MSSSLGLCRGTMLVVATLAFLISASPSVHGGTVERQPLSQAFGGSDTQAFGNFRPKVSMKTPFKRRGHMRWADGFSSPQGAGDSPWGIEHGGIDFFTKKDKAPFIAVFPGRVLFVHTAEQPFGWAVNVLLEFDEVFMAEYGFEPQSPGDAPLQTQLGLMRVAEGDQVKRGQILGYLHRPNEDSHVHFGFIENFTHICPEPFFKKKAVKKIMKILRKTWDKDVQMCY